MSFNSMSGMQGLCASATVEETGYAGSLAFTDYFHLLKNAAGVWKIYSKMYQGDFEGK